MGQLTEGFTFEAVADFGRVSAEENGILALAHA
jgi:hypothetical protein